MFPFWNYSCCGNQEINRKTHLEHQLRFLKWMRDNLEIRFVKLKADSMSLIN